MPGISMSCSGVMPASCSSEVMPAASIFSMVLGPTPARTVRGVGGAVRAVICSSISRRFSSSLFMSMSQPINLLARRTFWPFLADAQRKLRIFHDHFELFVFRVGDLHASDFRRAQGLLGERHRLFVVR